MWGERSTGGLGGASEGPLSRAAARTLYNLADVLAERAGDRRVDVTPYVIQQIRWSGVGAARRVWLLLTVLEWWPVLSFSGPGRFSWQPRAARRRALERFPRHAPLGATLACLSEWVLEAHADAAVRDSSETATDAYSPGA